MVISGRPTSKGMPMGTDLTATTMAEVIRMMLHETGSLSDRKTREGMLRLKTQVKAREKSEETRGLGLFLYSLIESWKLFVILHASSLIFATFTFPRVIT